MVLMHKKKKKKKKYRTKYKQYVTYGLKMDWPVMGSHQKGCLKMRLYLKKKLKEHKNKNIYLKS